VTVAIDINIPGCISPVVTNIEYHAVSNLPYDIVIGRGPIREYPMLEHIIRGEKLLGIPSLVQEDEPAITMTTKREGDPELDESVATDTDSDDEYPIDLNLIMVVDTDSVAKTIAEGELAEGSNLLGYEPEDDDLDATFDRLDEELQIDSYNGGYNINLLEAHGTQIMLLSTRKILEDNVCLFQTSVGDVAAHIPALQLIVDDKLWGQSTKNKGAPRVFSTIKNEEVGRQITKMLQMGVIQHSTAGRYSHVHLTPKPGGKWRFCIDYRLLNDCTETEGAVLPNIKHMLDALGQRKPKYVAIVHFGLQPG
jgi:hypothetical protein